MLSNPFIFISAVLIFVFIAKSHAANSTENNKLNLGTNNIAFELPDLTTVIQTESGEFQLEAFKSVSNDQILKDGDKIKQSQLLWVSAGHIKLQFNKSKNGTKKLFHKNTEGYHVFIQTLTNYTRQILSETASRKYNVTISQSQIVNLILSEFYCKIQLFDENGQVSIIKGKVSNFNEYPLRMDFVIPRKSKEQILFEKQLQSMQENKGIDIKLQCSMSSSGRKVRTNTLTISSKVIEQLNIVEKLFGDNNKTNDEVFVTRNQLVTLSGEIYSSMKIVEDYEIPETQFTADFIDGLLQQMSTSVKPISFDEALQRMSKYSTDFSSDLKPDEIKRQLSNVFKMKKTKNKTHIVVNKDFIKKLRESNSNSSELSANYGNLLFNIGGSVKYAQQNEKDGTQSNKTVDDQLRELNSATKDDVKWEIEGNRIVPKSLNVAKLVKGNLMKTLVFEKIRREYNDAPYRREFSIYHNQLHNEFIDQLEEVKKIVNLQSKELASIRNETLLSKQTAKEEINQLRNQFNQSNEERRKMKEQTQMLDKKVNENQANLVKIHSQIAPFSLAPTAVMKKISETFTQNYLSPVLCDVWGNYPLMDLKVLEKNYRWKDIFSKDNYYFVNLNPVMLPTELGGWTVCMIIRWESYEFSLLGDLCDEDEQNKNAPAKLSVRFKVKLLLTGFPSFETDSTFNLIRIRKYSYNQLWLISGTVNKTWPVPLVNIQVLKS